MSRPMLLMREDVLSRLHEERKLAGNTLTKLIARHKLDVTHPTLSRMLTHYAAMVSPDIDEANAGRIRSSMFPEWLTRSCGAVVSQPYEWYYTGIFPLGEWRRRE